MWVASRVCVVFHWVSQLVELTLMYRIEQDGYKKRQVVYKPTIGLYVGLTLKGVNVHVNK